MSLIETYNELRISIVAIVRKYEPLKIGDPKPEIPFILGTGFIVDDGLIATNNHIIEILDNQPKPPDTPIEEWPVLCLLFVEMNKCDYAVVPLEVIGKIGIKDYLPEGSWYGNDIPDIGFIRVKAKDLPVSKLNTDWRILKEGMELATAGFPMGRETFTAPGYLHQIGPTLQTGVLSALLPFPNTRPHAFILDILSLGGQSGSPIFHPDTGDILGILYGGLEEPAVTEIIKDGYKRPTSITYGIPAGLIHAGIEAAKQLPDYSLPVDTLSLREIINKYPAVLSDGRIHKTKTKLSENVISILNKE